MEVLSMNEWRKEVLTNKVITTNVKRGYLTWFSGRFRQLICRLLEARPFHWQGGYWLYLIGKDDIFLCALTYQYLFIELNYIIATAL